MSDILLELKNISKTYSTTPALQKISMQITRGMAIALLGPNGAGKSTTIKILCGLLPMSSGILKYENLTIIKEDYRTKTKVLIQKLGKIRQEIGYVPQNSTVDEKLTVYENLYVQGLLFHYTQEKLREKIVILLEFVQLIDRANNLVKTLSGGMRRRLEIARALLASPKILILDEPTLGLDPNAKMRIWKLIKNLQQEQNMTIILSTNNIDEAEFLADNYLILLKGKTQFLGSKADLSGSLSPNRTNFILECKKPLSSIEIECLANKYSINCFHSANSDQFFLETQKEKVNYSLHDLFLILFQEGIEFSGLRTKTPDLSDFFHQEIEKSSHSKTLDIFTEFLIQKGRLADE